MAVDLKGLNHIQWASCYQEVQSIKEIKLKNAKPDDKEAKAKELNNARKKVVSHFKQDENTANQIN